MSEFPNCYNPTHRGRDITYQIGISEDIPGDLFLTLPLGEADRAGNSMTIPVKLRQ